VTYQFVDFTEAVKEKVERIAKKQEKELQLAPKEAKLIEDMNFGRDLGPYIDKHLKLMYYSTHSGTTIVCWCSNRSTRTSSCTSSRSSTSTSGSGARRYSIC
jgi:hypothetical protein